MEPHPDGWLYFIQRGDKHGPVKIGRAKDPRKRLAAMQTGSPEPLRIIAASPGAARLEKPLHHLLREHRVSGEWYTAGAVTALLMRCGMASMLDELGVDSLH